MQFAKTSFLFLLFCFPFISFAQDDPLLTHLLDSVPVYTKMHGPHSVELGGLYDKIAKRYFAGRQYVKSYESFAKQAEVLEKALSGKEPTEALAKAYYNTSGLARVCAKYDMSLKYGQKAIIAYDVVLGPDDLNTLDARKRVLEYYVFTRSIDTTIAMGTQLIKDRERALGGKIDKKVIDMYNMIAVAYENRGDTKRAVLLLEEALQKQLELDTEEKDILTARLYNNIGALKANRGAHVEAIHLFEKSLAIRLGVQGEDSPDVAYAYLTLGDATLDLDQIKLAFDYLQKGVAIYERVYGLSHDRTAHAYGALAGAYTKKKRWTKAIEAYQKCIYIYLQLFGSESLKLAEEYNSLGILYYNKGDYKPAVEWLTKALNIMEIQQGTLNSRQANVYISLSQAYLQDSLWDKALTAGHNALICNVIGFDNDNVYALPDKKNLKDNILNVKLYQKGLGQKIQVFLSLYYTTKDQKYLKYAQQHATYLSEGMNWSRAALTNNQDKVKASSLAHQQFGHVIETYFLLWETTKDPKYIEKAFYFFERSKAASLSDILEEAEFLSSSSVPDSTAQRLKEVRSDLNFYEKEWLQARKNEDTTSINAFHIKMMQAKEELQQLEVILNKKYPVYAQLKNQDNLITLEQAQTFIIQEGELLLEFFVGEKHIYILAIEKNKVVFKKIPRNFERMLSRVLRSTTFNAIIDADVMEQECGMFGEALYLVYQKLMEPILHEDIKRIIIIPDGNLSYLSFEALISKPIKQDGLCSYEAFNYLLYDYPISYGYSAHILGVQQRSEKRARKTGILGFAASYANNSEDPMHRGLQELFGARSEVEWLEQTYGGKYFYGDGASETNFRSFAQDYSILHFAMHGRMSLENGLASHLIFTDVSQNNTDDDILYSYEAAQLPLNAEMIVLSACQTGLGEYSDGEGVTSIARGFACAGVPSLVMTLWKVNDQASLIIIKEFYKRLDEGMPKDEALQKAKIEYLNIYGGIAAHPIFWAAFVQLGALEPIYVNPPALYTQWWFWLIMVGILVIIIGAYRRMGKNK